jgi:hypothetical protein
MSEAPRGLVIFVLTGCAIIAGILIYSTYQTRQEQEAAGPVVVQPSDPCEDNALGFLYSLKRGDSVTAAAFWKPGVEPKTLFAVQGYKVMAQGPYLSGNGKINTPQRVYREFEVESSTQGGLPIRKRWDVVMEPSAKNYGNHPCAVVDLVEAE